jgi:hypothetical protein
MSSNFLLYADSQLQVCLFVDEFQNFATESFESILSEARKYRLNLVLGNQFMTQLTDKIREAIIGNVGTVISGRIGVTDAELMVKKYQPVFDAEDLTKLPNYQFVATVMINNVPSAPFSMAGLPPFNKENQQLGDAMKRLSATKYGFGRAVVEKEIFARLEPPKSQLPPSMASSGRPGGSPFAQQPAPPKPSGGSSFLDEWLAKRQQLGGANQGTPTVGAPSAPQPRQPISAPRPPLQPPAASQSATPFSAQPQAATVAPTPPVQIEQPVAPTLQPVATVQVPQPPAPAALSHQETPQEEQPLPPNDQNEVSVRLR